MGFCAKLGQQVFNSCFEITVHRHREGENGYLQLLEVNRSKDETVFVVHEFLDKERIGFFFQCYSKGESLRIYSMLLKHFSKEEAFRLAEEKRKFEKMVCYENTHKPWFFHPTNKYLLTDTFISSVS